MKTVKEVSKESGVTIRGLHYYDEIGLLKPTKILENGYRYYDEGALLQLQEILFFRELDFPLKEIKAIMENPHYNKEETLKNQIHLLSLKKERLENIIDLAKNALKGEKIMELKAFDNKEIKETQKKYEAEAKERWGETDAYRESEDKTEKYTEEQWIVIRKEMDGIMAAVGGLVGTDPGKDEAQDLVKQWQAHLTKYYYDCTNEILSGLGQMYVGDERFTANIDVYGKGTAAFLSEAIAIYVKK